MKKISLLVFLIVILFSMSSMAQYNNLWIPDTLSGATFNLTIKDTFSQLRTGQQTITGGVNNKFWGPTLFVNKGDTVHMNVRNSMNDSTTIHWHGMHLPAVMDGGPHQVIPPGTLWQPYWKINNLAGTYWYHPHLHEMTLEHITKGIGGFMIVRDPQESALALPRKYGIDDIPIALTSRRYDASNQFVLTNTVYGDYMLTNGTPNAQVNLPKQYVRLRILNAEIERGYNLGFSDNRTFYIIGNDGGLLNTPVSATRVKLMVGERVEILVNLGTNNVGDSVNLMAYNSNQAFGFPGGEAGVAGEFGSLLNNIDFTVLHIKVANTTANPITSVPSVLSNNSYWTSADATLTRNLSITGGQAGANQPFVFDNTAFSLTNINKTINLNEIEKWTVTNNNIFGHTFHIHDVQFKIVARNGIATSVGDFESGWKDVMYVPRGENVSFVAKFDDYSDSIHPYMYHCHFSNHEDDGMMGQFVVKNTAVTPTITTLACSNAIYSAAPTANTLFNGTATIGYTGGNGLSYASGNAISSTGVIGLTATLQAGTLAIGTGNLIYTITGTPATSGNAIFPISIGGQTCNIILSVNSTPPNNTDPLIGSLNCAGVQFSSTNVYVNTPFNATASINYSGGNGASYAGGTAISSTGVTGLTAVLQSGILTNNTGNLIFAIQGTPVSTGYATFPINFGGQACSISIRVDSVNQSNINTGFDFLIAPNPVNTNWLTIKMIPSTTTIYYAWVYDELGRTIYMWPYPSALTGAGMNISSLPKGTYVLKIMDEANKEVVSKKFIKK